MKRLLIFAAIAAASLTAVGVARAHVTIHPNAIPSGAFTTVVVRVPNERSKASTTKVDVQFPPGIVAVSYAAVSGWKTTILYRKPVKPSRFVRREVDQVIWTGGLPPGQFVQFPISFAFPKAKPGTVLTFKALQTYSNGEVVRWIGPPSTAAPAATVQITAANAPLADYPADMGAPANVLEGHAGMGMNMGSGKGKAYEPSAPRTRTTRVSAPLEGLAVGLPLLALGVVALRRVRRSRA